MIYKNQRVSIPKQHKLGKRTDGIYVYQEYDSKYDPIRKRMDGGLRRAIGKVDESKAGKMFPNDNYFKFYGTSEVELLENKSPFSYSLSVGAFLVIDMIFKDLGLDKIIVNLFNKNSGLVKALITFYIDENTTISQRYKKWAYQNLTMLDTIPSDSTISNMMNNIYESNIQEEFLKQWNEQVQKLNKKGERTLINIDSTNFNTHSDNLELAEWGKAKKNENLPQVNLSYAVSQDTGLPLFYDLFPGSIVDSVSYPLLINRAKEFKHENVCFVLDRGYFTENNMKYTVENDYDFLIMSREWNRELKDHLSRIKDDLRNNSELFISMHSVHATKHKLPIFKHYNKELFVYAFYSDSKFFREMNSLDEKLKAFENTLKCSKKINDELIKQYKTYFHFEYDEDGEIIEYKINSDKRKELRDKAGYFTIVSSLDLSESEVLEIYKKRDVIEKTFMMIKSELDMEKFRVHSGEALNYKILLTFIASIVRSQVAHRCKPLFDRKSSENVNTVFDELTKLSIVKNDNGYRRLHALTAKQKRIFELIKIEESDLDDLVIEFNNMLSHNKNIKI